MWFYSCYILTPTLFDCRGIIWILIAPDHLIPHKNAFRVRQNTEELGRLHAFAPVQRTNKRKQPGSKHLENTAAQHSGHYLSTGFWMPIREERVLILLERFTRRTRRLLDVPLVSSASLMQCGIIQADGANGFSSLSNRSDPKKRVTTHNLCSPSTIREFAAG